MQLMTFVTIDTKELKSFEHFLAVFSFLASQRFPFRCEV